MKYSLISYVSFGSLTDINIAISIKIFQMTAVGQKQSFKELAHLLSEIIGFQVNSEYGNLNSTLKGQLNVGLSIISSE
jgi:hypothetical protein